MKRRTLREATREIASMSDAAIERDTAEKWAARAIVCFHNYAKTGDQKWLLRYDSYRHEALEHAALVEDHGKTVGMIQKLLKTTKRRG